jgi:hypothetical protein
MVPLPLAWAGVAPVSASPIVATMVLLAMIVRIRRDFILQPSCLFCNG